MFWNSALRCSATALALATAVGLSACGSEPKPAKKSACSSVSPAAKKPNLTNLQAPAAVLSPDAKLRATLDTNCGSFSFDLDPSVSPKAVAAFVERAKSGFYDGLSFHRVAPGFVIQGGDPLGSGTGGPGYTTVDTPPADQLYPRGTVAMAKSTDQKAGAAGSQFFVVTGEDAQLTPDYAVIGTVPTAMMEVPDLIIAEGVDPASKIPGAMADGPPANPIVIKRLTVKPLD